jgi:hypothetical protein
MSLMRGPDRPKNTAGTDAAFDALARIATDPTSDRRYPSGTVLVAVDSPDAYVLITRAINERKPIALISADGSDAVIRPSEPYQTS